MHVGHGRWAALGDSRERPSKLHRLGRDARVIINDAGNQMNVFAASIEKRYRQVASWWRWAWASKRPSRPSRRIAWRPLTTPTASVLRPIPSPVILRRAGPTTAASYIVDIARAFYEEDGAGDLDLPERERLLAFRERGTP